MIKLQIAQWAMVVGILAWVAFDMWGYYFPGNDLSDQDIAIIRWNYHPVWLPFLAGIFLCHIFGDVKIQLEKFHEGKHGRN